MKYIVLKLEDIEDVATYTEKETLKDIAERVSMLRKRQGRNTNPEYYIVNQDEPYAGEVRKLIEEHEGGE